MGGTCSGGGWHPECPETMPPSLPSLWGFAQPLLVGDLPQEPFDSERGTAARASSLPLCVCPSFCPEPASRAPGPARWLSLTPSSGPPGGLRQADCVPRSQHSCRLHCAGVWEAVQGSQNRVCLHTRRSGSRQRYTTSLEIFESPTQDHGEKTMISSISPSRNSPGAARVLVSHRRRPGTSQGRGRTVEGLRNSCEEP